MSQPLQTGTSGRPAPHDAAAPVASGIFMPGGPAAASGPARPAGGGGTTAVPLPPRPVPPATALPTVPEFAAVPLPTDRKNEARSANPFRKVMMMVRKAGAGSSPVRAGDAAASADAVLRPLRDHSVGIDRARKVAPNLTHELLRQLEQTDLPRGPEREAAIQRRALAYGPPLIADRAAAIAMLLKPFVAQSGASPDPQVLRAQATNRLLPLIASFANAAARQELVSLLNDIVREPLPELRAPLQQLTRDLRTRAVVQLARRAFQKAESEFELHDVLAFTFAPLPEADDRDSRPWNLQVRVAVWKSLPEHRPRDVRLPNVASLITERLSQEGRLRQDGRDLLNEWLRCRQPASPAKPPPLPPGRRPSHEGASLAANLHGPGPGAAGSSVAAGSVRFARLEEAGARRAAQSGLHAVPPTGRAAAVRPGPGSFAEDPITSLSLELVSDITDTQASLTVQSFNQLRNGLLRVIRAEMERLAVSELLRLETTMAGKGALQRWLASGVPLCELDHKGRGPLGVGASAGSARAGGVARAAWPVDLGELPAVAGRALVRIYETALARNHAPGSPFVSEAFFGAQTEALMAAGLPDATLTAVAHRLKELQAQPRAEAGVGDGAGGGVGGGVGGGRRGGGGDGGGDGGDTGTAPATR